jgi:hypothetical protein
MRKTLLVERSGLSLTTGQFGSEQKRHRLLLVAGVSGVSRVKRTRCLREKIAPRRASSRCASLESGDYLNYPYYPNYGTAGTGFSVVGFFPGSKGTGPTGQPR